MTTCLLTDTEDLCPSTCAKEGLCLWRDSEIVPSQGAKPTCPERSRRVAEEDGRDTPTFLDRRRK